MTPETLLSWMRQPETLDRGTLEELRMLLARYPYFQTARLLYLKNLYVLRDASFADELRQAVLFVADRRMLFQLIEGCLYDRRAAGKARLAAAAEKEEPSVDRTLALIDAFLADMPEEQSKQMELDYTMDYMAYLMQGSADDGGAGDPGEPLAQQLHHGDDRETADTMDTRSSRAEAPVIPSTSPKALPI